MSLSNKSSCVEFKKLKCSFNKLRNDHISWETTNLRVIKKKRRQLRFIRKKNIKKKKKY